MAGPDELMTQCTKAALTLLLIGVGFGFVAGTIFTQTIYVLAGF